MASSENGGRPRAKTLVRLDLENAYARLGVSPRMATEEIKEVINSKRKEVMRRRRTREAQQFGAEEAEMTRLQEIEDEIGSTRARARYDRANPQNSLLTIQPSPSDRWLDPKHRAGLATAWIIEELGREHPLPSPECLPFWAPGGLEPDLVAFLAEFVIKAGQDDAGTTRDDASLLPDVAALEQWAQGDRRAAGSPSQRREEDSPDG
jgi:hypothetical protein